MDTPIKDGGPAFPSKFEVLAGNMDPIKGRVVDSMHVYVSMGMTLRDWFAGQALAGWHGHIGTAEYSAEFVAKTAYAIADAMLAARETRK